MRARPHVPSEAVGARPALQAIEVEVLDDDAESDDEPATASTPAKDLEAASALGDDATASAAAAEAGWNFARPLGSVAPPADATTNEMQLDLLVRARKLREMVLRRMPPIDTPSAAGSDKGYRVHREAGGHVSVSVMGLHGLSPSEGLLDLHLSLIHI